MKSCIMAAWLLTVSFGNLIVVILAGAKLTEDMVRYFIAHISSRTLRVDILNKPLSAAISHPSFKSHVDPLKLDTS